MSDEWKLQQGGGEDCGWQEWLRCEVDQHLQQGVLSEDCQRKDTDTDNLYLEG